MNTLFACSSVLLHTQIDELVEARKKINELNAVVERINSTSGKEIDFMRDYWKLYCFINKFNGYPSNETNVSLFNFIEYIMFNYRIHQDFNLGSCCSKNFELIQYLYEWSWTMPLPIASYSSEAELREMIDFTPTRNPEYFWF